MKSELILSGVKLFNIKALGQGCRFGIKVSSKKQDGTYTKGTFLNCKYKYPLEEGIYTLTGFLGDNEYQDKNTLEFIVMNAQMEQQGQPKQSGSNAPVHYEQKQMPQSNIPEIDQSDLEIPF